MKFASSSSQNRTTLFVAVSALVYLSLSQVYRAAFARDLLQTQQGAVVEKMLGFEVVQAPDGISVTRALSEAEAQKRRVDGE